MPRSRRSRSLALVLGLSLAAVSATARDAIADIAPGPLPAPQPAPAAPAKAPQGKAAPGTVTPAVLATGSPTAGPGAAPSAAPTGDAVAPGLPAPDELPADMPEQARQILSIKWQQGPIQGGLGDVAEVQVPEGMIFADGQGTRRFLEINQNPTSGSELGMVAAQDFSWCMVFEFSDIGFVKDEDKEELDPEAILESLREGVAAANEQRRARGWGTVSLVGWAEPPRYEPTTNNLEWATRGQDDQDKSFIINHNIRILGRRGVMEANLIVQPDVYAATLPTARKLLTSFSYKSGERYAEYKPGDKIAEVGLIGLMTGGAVAVAAKTGILAKLGKGAGKLIALLVAGAAGIGAKLFKGRKQDNG